MKSRRRLSVANLIGIALLCAFAAQAGAATVSDVSIHARGNLVELHFKVRGAEPGWQITGAHQQLTIALAHTGIAIAARPLAGRELAPITDVQALALADGDARLIIAVKGKVDYAATLAAHDLVVRFAVAGTAPNIAAPIVIRTAPRRVFAQATGPPPFDESGARVAAIADRPAPAATAPLQTARLEAVTPRAEQTVSRLVMIDPGHGGHDPGTQSADGVAEKDLALAIATRLQLALRARAISAELTRADDRFISLAERTRSANQRRADLFVSIHLNASPNAETTGIETYYLNNTTDRATIRLAQMENADDSDSGDSAQPNLNYILTDLRQGDKANESMALARMIEDESVAALATATGIRVNALGAKQGPFYVLVGAAMPAVLVECGFLSNRGEADHLNDQAYQQGLADGIATAVADYFGGNVAVGNL